MKGIFHPEKGYDWEYPLSPPQESGELDPIEDIYYIEYIILHVLKNRRNPLMKKLGISELPERMVNCDDPSDELYEEYLVLREQVAREPDAEVLKEAAYEAPTQMARFAFCYLTKYSYSSPRNDAYSYRTYECGWKDGMTTEDVIEFCREMIKVEGPFVREAREILADPPKDHNDYRGKRMVSHERAMSEPPYVRKQRLAPFRESKEYEQSRAEVLHLETQGHEALAASDKEKAAMLFNEMSYKSEQLGKYTQRWDAIEDYARSLICIADVIDYYDGAIKAAEILRRLIRECPEEKAFREHLKKAEEVYRKAAEKFAAQTGSVEDESPIVVYHYFDPKDAEVIRRLMEKWYRARGGKRQIVFRRQETVFPEPPEIVDIYCCDLSILIEMYGLDNIDRISPFIDTDNVFPALLEQSAINEEARALPVLVLAGAESEDIVDSGTAGSEEGTGKVTEAGGATGAAESRTTSYRTCVAFMNHSSWLNHLDRLDLMMLMTDSDFLFDVCMACNAGDGTPHVYPADRAAFARLAEKEPGADAVFNWINTSVSSN